MDIKKTPGQEEEIGEEDGSTGGNTASQAFYKGNEFSAKKDII